MRGESGGGERTGDRDEPVVGTVKKATKRDDAASPCEHARLDAPYGPEAVRDARILRSQVLERGPERRREGLARAQNVGHFRARVGRREHDGARSLGERTAGVVAGGGKGAHKHPAQGVRHEMDPLRPGPEMGVDAGCDHSVDEFVDGPLPRGIVDDFGSEARPHQSSLDGDHREACAAEAVKKEDRIRHRTQTHYSEARVLPTM